MILKIRNELINESIIKSIFRQLDEHRIDFETLRAK